MREELPENVAARIEGDKLVIEVDLSHGLDRTTATGKSQIVAATNQAVFLPGPQGVGFKLMVYKAKRDNPVTPGQVRLLRRFGAEPPQTAGEARDMIDALMTKEG